MGVDANFTSTERRRSGLQDEEPSPPSPTLTQGSYSNSNSEDLQSQAGGSQAGTPGKRKKRREEVSEVGTEQLPGPDFNLDILKKREAIQQKLF